MNVVVEDAVGVDVVVEDAVGVNVVVEDAVGCGSGSCCGESCG